MPAEHPEITPQILLEHMEKMQKVLQREIGGVEKRLGGVEVRLAGVEERLGGVEERLGRRIDRLEVNLTAQIAAIDKRLDAIEIEDLPGRMAAVERIVSTG